MGSIPKLKTDNLKTLMKLLWLTDLHLDWANIASRRQFYAALVATPFDAVVITGDIATAASLPSELLDLGRACAPRPVFFVLGNHDFYGSSFAEVDRAVAAACAQQTNLHHLGQGDVIPLTATAALVGHRGWADGLAGRGDRTNVKCKDIRHIADLKLNSAKEVFDKLEALGRDSASCFQDVLPGALQSFNRVWVATHVPPFQEAATFNGKQCGNRYLPHYCNVAGGKTIQRIAGYFPKKRITILSGHTHDQAGLRALPNTVVLVGGATRGQPQIQRVFDLDAV